MCLFCRLNKQYVNFNIYITNNKCWNNILMSINTNGIRIHFLTKTISSCIRTFEFFPLFHNNNLNIVESGVKHHNHNHDNTEMFSSLITKREKELIHHWFIRKTTILIKSWTWNWYHWNVGVIYTLLRETLK